MRNETSPYTGKPWLKQYDSHVPGHLEYPQVSLVELFEQAVSRNPDMRFLHFSGNDHSYKDIGRLVENLSASLILAGLEKGQRVALILPNLPQFVIAYFAILKAGGVVAAMNPNYKLPEFKFLFEDSEPSMAVCLDRHSPILEEIGMPLGKTILVRADKPVVGDQTPESSSDRGCLEFNQLCQPSFSYIVVEFPKVSPDDPAIFQYSGGTTGIPKAAIGSHRNIAANITQFKTWCDLKEGGETILAVIPLYHVYGMVLTMNLAIAAHSEVVLVDDPGNTDQIIAEIEGKKVTFYPGVPTMFYAINHHPRVQSGEFDVSSIKACISGSAPLHPDIKAEFERLTGGKLVEGYGLSEAPTATHCNPVFGNNKAGSIGLPLPDVECRVVDLETGEKDVLIGEVGELVIKGPQVMTGYHNQPIEEKIAMRDGWLYTGDVVNMDKEGYFFIVDRKKSLIKVSGFQVWPNEIERVILLHSDVAACAVGGVPDMKQGERVITWVVKKSGGQIRSDEIREWCKERLVSYKVPAEVYFIEQLPRSGVGKVLRRELIREYVESNHESPTENNPR